MFGRIVSFDLPALICHNDEWVRIVQCRLLFIQLDSRDWYDYRCTNLGVV